MQRYHFFLVLLFLSLSATASAELNVIMVESGVFERRGVTSEPGTLVISSGPEQIIPTKKVIAKLGTKFGIRYSLGGKQKTNNLVTLLYLTPGIIDPGGERHDKYVEVKDLGFSSGSHTIAFQITEPYELVPGTWQMMVFEKDRLLVKESFEVVLKGTETLSDFIQTDQ